MGAPHVIEIVHGATRHEHHLMWTGQIITGWTFYLNIYTADGTSITKVGEILSNGNGDDVDAQVRWVWLDADWTDERLVVGRYPMQIEWVDDNDNRDFLDNLQLYVKRRIAQEV